MNHKTTPCNGLVRRDSQVKGTVLVMCLAMSSVRYMTVQQGKWCVLLGVRWRGALLKSVWIPARLYQLLEVY